MNVESTCRVCLKEQVSLKSLLNPNNPRNCLANRINESFVLDFAITDDTYFPTKICLECITELHQGLQFYEKIKNSQDRLSMLTIQVLEEPEPTLLPSIEEEELELTVKDEECAEEEEVVVEDYLIENFEVTTTEINDQIVSTNNQEKIYTCQSCFKVYDKKASYSYHIKTKHETERPHECENCGKRFAIRTDLVRHARIHSNEKRFVCSSCGKRFTDRSTHLKHEKMHTGVKSFICTFCPKSFMYSFALKSHTLTHTGEKSFPCIICQKYFARKSKMKDHFKRIHKRVFNPEDEQLMYQLIENGNIEGKFDVKDGIQEVYS